MQSVYRQPFLGLSLRGPLHGTISLLASSPARGGGAGCSGSATCYSSTGSHRPPPPRRDVPEVGGLVTQGRLSTRIGCRGCGSCSATRSLRSCSLYGRVPVPPLPPPLLPPPLPSPPSPPPPPPPRDDHRRSLRCSRRHHRLLRRLRLGTGCMIRPQSSMSKHIPVSVRCASRGQAKALGVAAAAATFVSFLPPRADRLREPCGSGRPPCGRTGGRDGDVGERRSWPVMPGFGPPRLLCPGRFRYRQAAVGSGGDRFTLPTPPRRPPGARSGWGPRGGSCAWVRSGGDGRRWRVGRAARHKSHFVTAASALVPGGRRAPAVGEPPADRRAVSRVPLCSGEKESGPTGPTAPGRVNDPRTPEASGGAVLWCSWSHIYGVSEGQWRLLPGTARPLCRQVNCRNSLLLHQEAPLRAVNLDTKC
uniref:Lysine-specific demethylase 6B-like n=1 Tax=Phascolarctos cinereus TaxID=38626 RepID=A0A6P5LK55_PHACI|nr:lysine-specific demethylase 6B-like [Phascolarctos cinereus]